ncbi:ABC transporter permease [Gammaproteobacteria bacterium LSUCC0057]|uniref:ABC transporter permease n=1 Tax=Gammaproteobacteria bacterium LSUCC0057 TaxID=2559237 RepID=A0A4Y8UL28_9GAMM|nr:ABC transporter permease [Gammaproteobacteria bacterium LSUCC0057]
MSRFIVGRIAQALLVMVVMSVVIYALIGLMPGDPIDLMISADPNMTSADAALLREIYGLDQPLYRRYLAWLGNAVQGDLGYSRLFGQPVLQVLLPALGNTLILMATAFIIAIAIALPLGTLAAAKPRSAFDYSVNMYAFAGISLPSFWLALLLIMLFSVNLGWLPAGGMAAADASFGEQLRHLALPVATVATLHIGAYSRYMRSAMLEVLRHDYIRTARAKGASERRVIWVHAWRNALIPVVTVLALDFGFLFSGALVTETIFSWPGMGKLIFDAVMGNDFNLAVVALLFATALTLLGNLIADLLYGLLDPRIRAGGGR